MSNAWRLYDADMSCMFVTFILKTSLAHTENITAIKQS